MDRQAASTDGADNSLERFPPILRVEIHLLGVTFILFLLSALAAMAQTAPTAPAMQRLDQPCRVKEARASRTIPHVAGSPESLDYPALQSTVRGLWTDSDLYLLFTCPYKKLNIFSPTQNDRARDKLWDRDVVEMFLGDDWTNILHYREFEIAPTGDWVDLAIDLDRKSYNKKLAVWLAYGRESR
jgi:hypothetical protein